MLRKDICTIDNMAATIGVLIEFWNEGTIKDGDTILICAHKIRAEIINRLDAVDVTVNTLQMHNEVLPEGVPPRFN